MIRRIRLPIVEDHDKDPLALLRGGRFARWFAGGLAVLVLAWVVDAQVEAMGFMSDFEHELTGPERLVGPIVHMQAHPTGSPRPAITLIAKL